MTFIGQSLIIGSTYPLDVGVYVLMIVLEDEGGATEK